MSERPDERIYLWYTAKTTPKTAIVSCTSTHTYYGYVDEPPTEDIEYADLRFAGRGTMDTLFQRTRQPKNL